MKRTLFFIVLLMLGAIVAAQNIKEEKVETSFLEYPRIPVKGMDFNTMNIEFAHATFEIDELKVLKGTNLCKPKGGSLKDVQAIENYYYQVRYQLPAGLIRIADPAGKVLYTSYTNEADPTWDEFGKQECYFMESILKSVWEKQKDEYETNLQAQVSQDLYARAQSFVNKAVSFAYTPETIEVYYVKADKTHDYSAIEQAMNEAVKAYALLKNNYEDANGRAGLEKALATWEKELAQADVENKKAKINKKVATHLHENAALANAYLQKYEEALNHIKVALDLNANFTTNKTVYREALQQRFYDQRKYYDMNRDVAVVIKEEQPQVVNRGTAAYGELKADYQAKEMEEMKGQMMAVKKAHEEGVAAGSINPYQEKITHTTTQGYMLILPSVSTMAYSLEDMKAGMQKLDEFPAEVCELTQLNQLILKNSNIKTIPPEIKNLVNLKRLDLSKNQLTALPDELGQLKELNTLLLKGNAIPQSEIDKIQKALPKCKIKL